MSRYVMCPDCGHRLSRVYDGCGVWTGEYTCYYCGGMGDEYYDECDNENSEYISLSDAADIWRSNGEDEDYTFGYSEDRLRQA